jgi:hypothetical protein
MSSGTLKVTGELGITGKTSGSSGSGIRMTSATLIANSATIKNYTATSGGGLNMSGGSFTSTGNFIITDCKATSAGGGLYLASGTLALKSGSFIQNCAAATSAGGGVYVAGGTLALANTEISTNTASSGGGVYIAGSGIAEMSGGSIISGNSASKGNGVYIEDTATLKISGSSSVAEDNDVYIETQTTPSSHQGTIWVDGALTHEVVATITPSNYQPIYVLSGTASDIENAMLATPPKFKLKQPSNSWTIDKTGRLLKPSTINCIIGGGALQFSSSDPIVIRQNALGTFTIMVASHTVFRKGSSPIWRYRRDGGTSLSSGSVIYYDQSRNVLPISQDDIEYADYSISLSGLGVGVHWISVELTVDGIIYSGVFRITVSL